MVLLFEEFCPPLKIAWLVASKFVLTSWSNIQVGNLGASVEKWTVGGTALTSLMDVERRHGILNSSF